MCTTPKVTVFAPGTKFTLFPFEGLSALLFCENDCGNPFALSSGQLFLHEYKRPDITEAYINK